MSLTTLYTKIRDLILDQLTPGYDVFEYVNSKTFTLSASTVSESSLKVYKNGTLIVESPSSGVVNYTFDSQTSKLTFSSTYSLTPGDVIETYYNCYKQFTNAEIRQYISSAIIRLSVKKYQTFILREDDTIFPTPIESDENLICLIASILMEGNVAMYKTNEVIIEFAKDEDNEERIRIAIREFKKCYGVIDYHNLRRPYTMYVEDSDMTLENLP